MINNWKFKIKNRQAGMTYVELIVVMSIFAIVTGTVIFNYKDFQVKVDMKNLSNDIALKIFEAQKNALSGKLPSSVFGLPPNWKPSYGVYFQYALVPHGKVFYTFIDKDNSGWFDELFSENCPINECLEKYTINKDNFYDQDIAIYIVNSTPIFLSSEESLNIVFTRPDSKAVFMVDNAPVANADYVQLTLNSQSSIQSVIKVYASGRIQID